MTPDGRFDVAWTQVFSANDTDVWEKSFDASGIRTAFNPVGFSTAQDYSPSISMDIAGDAVVAWVKAGDIKARRINSAGVMGPEINIFSTSRSATNNVDPSVAL